MATYVAVIGPSLADDGARDAAFRVGALLAGRGAIVVCGGGGGAMEAACRGAKSAGGLTLGILPGRSRAEANPFVDIAVPTGMGEARNALVVRASDAVIAVGGGFGTLSEIGLALKMGRPVVGLATWQVEAPPRDDPGDAAGAAVPIRPAATPEEAVGLALELAGEPRDSP